MAAEATGVAEQSAAAVEEIGLLDQIVEKSKVAKSETEHQRAKDIISELAREVLEGTVVVSDNLNLTLDARIAEIDRIISEQLSAVMHAPQFQQLESTWRGLHFVEQMSHVAAAAHAPFISAASEGMFGLETFTDLGKPRDMAKIFDTVEYAKWKSFRESEDSRYVGLTLPRFLGRLPYNPKDGTTVEGFNFVEEVDAADHSKFLWCNTAYAMAARLTHAFEDYGWCAAIRGVEGGGLVEDLPTHTFRTDDGEVALKCPTEVAITDRREKELSDLGFIPLVHCKNTDYAAFFGAQSAQKPKKYNTDSANANAILSAQLQYMFAVSRIAHYLKAMMREKIGSFASAGNVEEFLNRWISQYVLLDDNASQEAKAQYPLREAAVNVSEVPGKPGVYRAVAFIRPHFQLDELSVSLRLVAELPATAQKS